MVHFLESISSIAGHVWRYLHKTGNFKHTLNQQVALAMQQVDWFQSAVQILGFHQCRFWMFEPPGCIGELLMGKWSLSLQSPHFPGQKISSHALCFSSNVQLIPHVISCYIIKCCFCQLGITAKKNRVCVCFFWKQ